MDSMVMLGNLMPKGVAVLFLILAMFKIFRFIGTLLGGLGIVGLALPLIPPFLGFGQLASGIVLFIIGASVARYCSEDQPVIYFVMVILGVIMLCLNWPVVQAHFSNPVHSPIAPWSLPYYNIWQHMGSIRIGKF